MMSHTAQKSKDILFKKLQKEIENAIRSSDANRKGSLDLNELEATFFALDYLPLLREVRFLPRQARPIYNQNSSNAIQLQQEETFIDAFWRIINPRQLPRVQNAHIYDILLLVVYKVN